MGKGSTQFQHLVQTEVPPKLLEDWLGSGASARHPGTEAQGRAAPAQRRLRAARAAPSSTRGRREGRQRHLRDDPGSARAGILSVRDQNTFDAGLRQKRLMTLRSSS
jgi:isocitrate lyase